MLSWDRLSSALLIPLLRPATVHPHSSLQRVSAQAAGEDSRQLTSCQSEMMQAPGEAAPSHSLQL